MCTNGKNNEYCVNYRFFSPSTVTLLPSPKDFKRKIGPTSFANEIFLFFLNASKTRRTISAVLVYAQALCELTFRPPPRPATIMSHDYTNIINDVMQLTRHYSVNRFEFRRRSTLNRRRDETWESVVLRIISYIIFPRLFFRIVGNTL